MDCQRKVNDLVREAIGAIGRDVDGSDRDGRAPFFGPATDDVAVRQARMPSRSSTRRISSELANISNSCFFIFLFPSVSENDYYSNIEQERTEVNRGYGRIQGVFLGRGS